LACERLGKAQSGFDTADRHEDQHTEEDDTMTNEELTAIRERCDAATPGPWLFEQQDDSVWAGFDGALQVAHCQSIPGAGMLKDRKTRRANATFIAHVRVDIPALLAEVERLREALEAVEWMFNDTGDFEGSDFCPWCNGCEKFGHMPNCQRQLALGVQL
jgi:hypothetical protein